MTDQLRDQLVEALNGFVKNRRAIQTGDPFQGDMDRLFDLAVAALKSAGIESCPPEPDVVGVLEEWVRWEADIIYNADWSSGRAHLTHEQHDALTNLQEHRNAILTQLRGES